MSNPGGMSRRDLIRGLFQRKKAAPPAPPPVVSYVTPPEPAAPPAPRFGRGVPLPILRPPGAIEEAAFLKACTRCNECLKACPHEAIALAPPRMRSAAGTPYLNTAHAPCRMCDDRPCIAACDTGALRFDIPARMGTAFISPLTCLAHQNTPCSVCIEQCPVDGAIQWDGHRPVVNPDACTGCGVCHYVCPAPQNAVMLLPAKERPLPPAPEVRREP